LPLAAPGIVAGVVTAFAACLGEFGAIITFVSNIPGETRTLPLAIYTAIQTPGGEAAAARLAALSIGLALAGLVFADWLGRRTRTFVGQCPARFASFTGSAILCSTRSSNSATSPA